LTDEKIDALAQHMASVRTTGALSATWK